MDANKSEGGSLLIVQPGKGGVLAILHEVPTLFESNTLMKLGVVSINNATVILIMFPTK